MIDKYKLAKLYNMSDIEALNYMLPFLQGENKKLCERLIYLNNETSLGWGNEDHSPEEANEYFEGKWKLLNHFGIESDNGDAIVKEVSNEKT